jgi:hypothetical protein
LQTKRLGASISARLIRRKVPTDCGKCGPIRASLLGGEDEAIDIAAEPDGVKPEVPLIAFAAAVAAANR